MKEKDTWNKILHEWVDDKSMKDRLFNLVEIDRSIAEIKNKDGKKAIDRAIPECKEKMEEALRLFQKFHVEDGPILHRSRTACVFMVSRYEKKENEEESKVPTALKCMDKLDQVVAELEGRKRLKAIHVIGILGVYVDCSVNKSELEELKTAANACGVPVPTQVQGLENSVSDIISTKAGKRSLDEDQAKSSFKFVLVFNFAERTLDAALKHDRVVTRPLLAKLIAADLASAISHVHSRGRIHADIKPLNILREGEEWKLADLDVSCIIGNEFGSKPPSSGYCPPEIAEIVFNAISNGKVNKEILKSYCASTSYDLWSYGAVLFHLILGQPLWKTDHDDNIVDEEKIDLVYWDKSALHEKTKKYSTRYCKEAHQETSRT